MNASARDEDLLDLARGLAVTAAEVLRARPTDLGAESKSTPTDTVTVMDRAAERVILDGLAAARPDDAVVSEESAARPGMTDVTWFVDPLDGTVNYLYDIGQYAVSIAAAVAGVTRCGVVLDVSRGVTYTARLGGGAYREDRRLACATETELSRALLATGFGYDARLRAAQADVLQRVLPAVRDIRRFGSCALDLCALAAGQVDGYYETGPYPWDWRAGALIATEAGAVVDVPAWDAHADGATAGTVVGGCPGIVDGLRELLGEPPTV